MVLQRAPSKSTIYGIASGFQATDTKKNVTVTLTIEGGPGEEVEYTGRVNSAGEMYFIERHFVLYGLVHSNNKQIRI